MRNLTHREGYTKSGYMLTAALSAVAGFGLMIALLFTAMQFVCYSSYDMYREEYEKYNVVADLPEGVTLSEEDGLMAVTKHMMRYLIGDSEVPDLQVQINTADGMRDFFSERELLHMADCKALFRKALQLRYICLMFAVFVPVYGRYAILKDSGPLLKAASRGALIGFGTFFAAALAIAIYMVTNFSTAFVTFHHIFFDNDLWLLDPRESLLINILPEGFFFDVVKKIIAVFVPVSALFVAASIYLDRKYRNVVLKYREK